MTSEIINGQNSENCIIFAHGAGAPMDTDFMNYFADGLSAKASEKEQKSWQVIRFEFPYMQQRRLNGSKRPPNTQKVLLESWQDIVNKYRPEGKLVLAGKSMGGRMASLIADSLRVDGLILFGYPFHPPGKPEKTRTQHLEKLQTKTLILQGERDALGNKDEVAGYQLSPQIEIFWLADGDHGLKPRKKSGFTTQQNWQLALDQSRSFLAEISR